MFWIRMPITQSAKKAVRRSLKLRQRNFDFKLRMKMAIKKFRKAIEKGDKVTQEQVNTIYKYIDKCVKVGILKKKNWGRKKHNIAVMFDKVNKK